MVGLSGGMCTMAQNLQPWQCFHKSFIFVVSCVPVSYIMVFVLSRVSRQVRGRVTLLSVQTCLAKFGKVVILRCPYHSLYSILCCEHRDHGPWADCVRQGLCA